MNPATPSTAEAGATPLVWIDATRAAAGWRLWGMSLVERQVRQVVLLGLPRVRVWLSPRSEAGARRRPDFERLYTVDLRFVVVEGTRAQWEALARVQEPVLFLEGDALYDERILQCALERGPDTLVRGEAAVLHLSAGQARALGRLEGGEAAALHLGARVCSPEDLDAYLPSLRLSMTPYLVRVRRKSQLPLLDHLMYRRTFKQVIDVVARYGYYHLVRWITRQLSRTMLPPNLFTFLSILGIWAAVPCFALGFLGAGLVAAWLGVLLDSVDGKLARLTLNLSDAMGSAEHISAALGLGLWYLALGWHLSGGMLFEGGALVLATWGLVGMYALDKILSGGFRSLYGKELFDYRAVDAAFHLMALRRNLSLLFLGLGVVMGRVEAAFLALVGWMGATLVFHGLRFGWIAARAGRPREGEAAGS